MKKITRLDMCSMNKIDSITPMYLYKYRTWGISQQEEILTNQTLYYASAEQFEDEKDCHPIMNSRPTIQDLYNYSIEITPQIDLEEHQMLIREWYSNYYNTPRRKIETLVDEVNKRRYRMFGVLCLTRRHDNAYLWNQYSRNHNGFCVEFDMSRLLKYLPNPCCHNVIYTDEKPIINTYQPKYTDFPKTFQFKQLKYKREEEYRYLMMSDSPLTQKERNVKFDISCIKCVYIDRQMETQYKEIIYRTAEGTYKVSEMDITIQDDIDEAIINPVNRKQL